MEIKQIGYDKFSIIVFENVYNKDELDLVWQETNFLCHEHKLYPADIVGSALEEDGSPKKKNKGIWLDDAFKKGISNYLRLYKCIVDVMDSNRDTFVKNDINLKLFYHTNMDSTLLSYYEDKDYYKAHHDESCYTLVYYLFKEPKKFTGGDLTFTEIDQKVNINSNMAILFPSWIDHEVDKITMPDNVERYKSNGRFCFSTFFAMRY